MGVVYVGFQPADYNLWCIQCHGHWVECVGRDGGTCLDGKFIHLFSGFDQNGAVSPLNSNGT